MVPKKPPYSNIDMKMSNLATDPDLDPHVLHRHAPTTTVEHNRSQPGNTKEGTKKPKTHRIMVPELSMDKNLLQDTDADSHVGQLQDVDNSNPQAGLLMLSEARQSQSWPQAQSSSTVKTITSQKKLISTGTLQEATVAELKARRSSLIASLAALSNVQEMIVKEEDTVASLQTPHAELADSHIIRAANEIVKTHIRLLHEYNEIKDVGQGLMGLIADARGVRIVEVQDEFGIDSKD